MYNRILRETLNITAERAVLVEAYLRLEHSTLGHLSRFDFQREYTVGGICETIDADYSHAVDLAESFGLSV